MKVFEAAKEFIDVGQMGGSLSGNFFIKYSKTGKYAFGIPCKCPEGLGVRSRCGKLFFLESMYRNLRKYRLKELDAREILGAIAALHADWFGEKE